MFGVLVVAVLIPLVIIYLIKNAYHRPHNFPPGPPSLPVYGAYWIILANEYNNLANAFVKLGKKYKTKVLGFYFGSFPTVVINDPDLIKEMLNREEFDGRLDTILGRFRSYWKKLGIFFTDGYFWHEQRRFSLRYMRDFGFGRRDETLESVIAGEIQEMIDMRINGPKFKAEKDIIKGDLAYMPHYLAVPFINGMLHVYGRMTVPRSDYHSLWTLSRGGLLFQRSSDDFGRALVLTPGLKDFLPTLSGYKGLRKGHQTLLNFFEKFVDEALETYNESYERHFLDIYIKKMKEEEREKARTTFSVDQLRLICVDYIFPAATATEQVLCMLIERLLIEPKVQDKIHEEIDRVVGRNRLPNLDDRRNMPYTEACIREAMRMDTLVPMGVPHRAQVDTKLGGYDIPENAVVTANYVMLHMDKDIWGDPENFRPERFIVDGKLDVSKDKSLPFGAGKRLCAGETYARQCMFQVFAGLLQAFHLSTPDGKPLKQQSQRIQGIITSIPESYVKLTPRK